MKLAEHIDISAQELVGSQRLFNGDQVGADRRRIERSAVRVFHVSQLLVNYAREKTRVY